MLRYPPCSMQSFQTQFGRFNRDLNIRFPTVHVLRFLLRAYILFLIVPSLGKSDGKLSVSYPSTFIIEFLPCPGFKFGLALSTSIKQDTYLAGILPNTFFVLSDTSPFAAAVLFLLNFFTFFVFFRLICTSMSAGAGLTSSFA